MSSALTPRCRRGLRNPELGYSAIRELSILLSLILSLGETLRVWQSWRGGCRHAHSCWTWRGWTYTVSGNSGFIPVTIFFLPFEYYYIIALTDTLYMISAYVWSEALFCLPAVVNSSQNPCSQSRILFSSFSWCYKFTMSTGWGEWSCKRFRRAFIIRFAALPISNRNILVPVKCK